MSTRMSMGYCPRYDAGHVTTSILSTLEGKDRRIPPFHFGEPNLAEVMSSYPSSSQGGLVDATPFPMVWPLWSG